MGQTLEKPVVDKVYGSGEGNNTRYGVCSMQGWRLDMEDAHTTMTSLADNFSDCSFYAVFDGHAGSYTSNICSQKLHDFILKKFHDNGFDSFPDTLDEDKKTLFDKLIRDSFVEFDDELKNSEPYKSLQETCGTTATTVLITPKFIIFGNCGDSRGFLAREDSVLFQTKDHKPVDPVEKERIEESGGTVVMERVNGNLAVSRAIGDFSFKDRVNLDTRLQAVSPEPTVTIISREQDNFVVLACDGIWDVMSCEEVRFFVESRMKVTTDLSQIASEIIDVCLLKDSRDNMSLIIIAFENAPKICETEKNNEKIYEEEIRRKVTDYVTKFTQNITLLGTLDSIIGQEFYSCATSSLGVYAKSSFVEALINELSPKRNKDRDYSGNNILSNFPMALQAIQNLVKGDSPDQSQSGDISDAASSDSTDGSGSNESKGNILP